MPEKMPELTLTQRDGPMNQDVKERKLMKREQVLEGTVSVREVLHYIESDRYMDLREATSTPKGKRIGYLPLSEKTLRKHLKEIPHFRCGGKIIFKKSDLDRWMENFIPPDQVLDEAVEKVEEMFGGKTKT